MMTIQQEIYWIIFIIKTIIRSLVYIYTTFPQQISFVGKFKEDDGLALILTAE